MTTPKYCTQNNGDCPSCSLVNYGRDCQNNLLKGRWFSLGDLAQAITGGRLAEMAKLLNDAGTAQLDELEANPGTTIPREALIDLAAVRAGDRVGRKAAWLLAV